MDNIVYLDEFLLKRDLAEVRKNLERARYLVSIVVDVPQTVLEDLQLWELELEDRLKQLILD